MNKELSKEEILKKHYDVLTSSKDGNWASWDKVLEYGDAEISFLAMQEYADQEKKKAIEALKNIQNLLSGEPSEENAKDAYLIATGTLKLFNQQK